MTGPSPELPGSLLKQVSRSFYLTLRILPEAIRPQIGLAYLLARASDTIADTGLLAPAERLNALERLRRRVSAESRAPIQFSLLAESQANPAERALLLRAEETIALLEQFPLGDRARIRAVLNTIISGQELDLRRFSPSTAGRIVALQTDEELDDYTYRVAGCVGEFWTDTCLAHLFPEKLDQREQWLRDGVRFGKGLQLVNILRDIPRDLRQGRCYLPLQRLAAADLQPHDLLDPAREPRFRPLYDAWLDQARRHLAAGWNYTISLPSNQRRLRLACAWPVLIGMKTLERLKTENVLDPSKQIKVSRADINRIILATLPQDWGNLDPGPAR